MQIEMAFIEQPTLWDKDQCIVVSGHRIETQPLKIYPFGFGVTLKLDARSRIMAGVETLTVTEADLLTDCPEVKPHLKKVTDCTRHSDVSGRVRRARAVATPETEKPPVIPTKRFTPYLTRVDLKRMDTGDLCLVVPIAREKKIAGRFAEHWSRIHGWIAEIRPEPPPPPGTQLELS